MTYDDSVADGGDTIDNGHQDIACKLVSNSSIRSRRMSTHQ